MKFDAIDLTNNGNIRYSLQRWARDKAPFLSIIHLAFSGDYRLGSRGAPDAYYISGLVHTVDAIWHPSAMILDLSTLHYEWGNDMDLVLQPLGEVVAFVVGPKCERAISTLLYGVDTTKSVLEAVHFFDAFEPALKYVRQALVIEWNAKVEKRPPGLGSADLITLDDLQ
jgi:hypothetical protein